LPPDDAPALPAPCSLEKSPPPQPPAMSEAKSHAVTVPAAIDVGASRRIIAA
jgi:hypothetical protein